MAVDSLYPVHWLGCRTTTRTHETSGFCSTKLAKTVPHHSKISAPFPRANEGGQRISRKNPRRVLVRSLQQPVQPPPAALSPVPLLPYRTVPYRTSSLWVPPLDSPPSNQHPATPTRSPSPPPPAPLPHILPRMRHRAKHSDSVRVVQRTSSNKTPTYLVQPDLDAL
ncbi:hypothetical protein K402DRAFT_172652 [Aulographum hederae CBS 113979]|uniref:Uncharacterized protein n=1 Tax=Aulographum hederae CBS 113979 TaxID=1176131 RepID=A0A6G1HD63_9PEZI|nr:hypothetical protein K402DRAFT_172652 [Aulographum hederae CBS 113979]